MRRVHRPATGGEPARGVPATFFNFEFPANYFHLRRPGLDPPAGSDLLTEPEIHARLCEALGAVGEAELAPLREAARQGRAAYAAAFVAATGANPKLAEPAPVILYRTLGPTLPDGAAAAAVLWGAARRLALGHPDAVRRAGIDAPDHGLGEALFARILESRSRAEAIEWAKRAPAPHGPDQEGEIELRQFFELDDFAPGEAIDRARELERELGNKK